MRTKDLRIMDNADWTYGDFGFEIAGLVGREPEAPIVVILRARKAFNVDGSVNAENVESLQRACEYCGKRHEKLHRKWCGKCQTRSRVSRQIARIGRAAKTAQAGCNRENSYELKYALGNFSRGFDHPDSKVVKIKNGFSLVQDFAKLSLVKTWGSKYEITAEVETEAGNPVKIVIETDGPDWRADVAVKYGATAHPRDMAHELSRVIQKQLLQYWAGLGEEDEPNKYKILEEPFVLNADVIGPTNAVAEYLYKKGAYRGAAILHLNFEEGDEEYVVANRGGEHEALELVYNIKTSVFTVRGGRTVSEKGGGLGFWSNTIWEGKKAEVALEHYRSATYCDITAKPYITIRDLKYM